MGRAALELPPGAERVRLALFEELPAGMPAAGLVGGPQLLERREAPPLRLSDIVLGSPTVVLSWMPTERDTVWFNPAGRFQRTVPLEVYYEVAGVTPGSETRTEIAVTRRRSGVAKLFGGRDQEIRLRFTATAEESIVRVARTLDLNRLEPGQYRLVVNATDATGKSISADREFDIVD